MGKRAWDDDTSILKRVYEFVEPGSFIPSPVFTRMTGQEILDFYWETWKKNMTNKFGEDSDKITQENCIQDFCVVHWATPIQESENE